MKVKVIFRSYIHELVICGTKDKINPPSLPYKAWQYQRNFIAIGMNNRAKVKNLPTDYDADAICATQNCGKLQRKHVAIATKMFGRDKIYDADAICAMQNCGKVK
jgi:hypothetical protein